MRLLNKRRKHICFCYDKDGVLIGHTWNWTTCAEREALIRYPESTTILVCQIICKGTKFKISNSMPCCKCRESLIGSSVQNVAFSTKTDIQCVVTTALPETDYCPKR